MGPDQLGVALVLAAGEGDTYARARELMARFAQGVVEGLGTFGIDARFRGKNDVEVGGRKIAGLGIYRHPSAGMLFHASILVGLDVAHMLRVLDTPFEKITDKELATVSARTCTVRRETGREVSVTEVRDAIAEGYRRVFGVALERGELDAAERSSVDTVEAEKYLDPRWVRQRIEVPDAFGSARRKTPGGLLELRVTLAGSTLKAVFIAGDFFAPEGAIADLEGRLRWHSSHPRALEATLREAYARWGDELGSLALPDLLETLAEAVRSASHAGAKEQLAMYGCFVNPQGT